MVILIFLTLFLFLMCVIILSILSSRLKSAENHIDELYNNITTLRNDTSTRMDEISHNAKIINERLETHKHAYEFNDSVLYIKEPV